MSQVNIDPYFIDEGYITSLRDFIDNPSYGKLKYLDLHYHIPFPCAHISKLGKIKCADCPAGIDELPGQNNEVDQPWCSLVDYFLYISEEEYEKQQGAILLTIIRILAFVDQD